jgi:hypothetical protein
MELKTLIMNEEKKFIVYLFSALHSRGNGKQQ